MGATEALLGLAARWRAFEEEHALDGLLLHLVEWAAPTGPTRILDDPAPRLMPCEPAKVSVVIPCYNYAHYLPDAVASALGQRGVDVEVVVVDDRSTDDSLDVALKLAESDDRVRVLVNDENSGHVRSFNAGWEVSSGEFAVKLDADDLLTHGSLSRAVALMEAHPNVGLVYGHPRHFSSFEPPAGRFGKVRWRVWDGRDWLAERCRLGVSAITNPEMVLRASVLRDLGPMDPTVPYAPDMEISLRIAAVADVGYVWGADQALHREHPGSMSETDGSGVLLDLQARADAFRCALEKTAQQLANPEDLDAAARRALAADALRFASAAQDRRAEAAVFEPLIVFARTCWPDCTSWTEFRRVSEHAPSGNGGYVGAAARRARRRWRDEGYHLRWLVSGV